MAFITAHSYVKHNYSLSVDDGAFGSMDNSVVGNWVGQLKQVIRDQMVKAGAEEYVPAMENLLDIVLSPLKIRITRDNQV